MDESPIGSAGLDTDGVTMDKPLVRCRTCERTWHSRTMADGLRTIGRCPRCGGELVWDEDAPRPTTDATAAVEDRTVAPHLVLGVPRR